MIPRPLPRRETPKPKTIRDLPPKSRKDYPTHRPGLVIKEVWARSTRVVELHQDLGEHVWLVFHVHLEDMVNRIEYLPLDSGACPYTPYPKHFYDGRSLPHESHTGWPLGSHFQPHAAKRLLFFLIHLHLILPSHLSAERLRRRNIEREMMSHRVDHDTVIAPGSLH